MPVPIKGSPRSCKWGHGAKSWGSACLWYDRSKGYSLFLEIFAIALVKPTGMCSDCFVAKLPKMIK